MRAGAATRRKRRKKARMAIAKLFTLAKLFALHANTI